MQLLIFLTVFFFDRVKFTALIYYDTNGLIQSGDAGLPVMIVLNIIVVVVIITIIVLERTRRTPAGTTAAAAAAAARPRDFIVSELNYLILYDISSRRVYTSYYCRSRRIIIARTFKLNKSYFSGEGADRQTDRSKTAPPPGRPAFLPAPGPPCICSDSENRLKSLRGPTTVRAPCSPPHPRTGVRMRRVRIT